MLKVRWKRTVAALSVGLALTAAVPGPTAAAIGLAQASPTPGAAPGAVISPERQQFLDAVAKRLGITTQQLQEAIAGARTDVGARAPGPGQRDGRHAAMYGLAAQTIGITPQQLRQELPGKSLAQVATAHGKNPADVATALKNAANGRIDQEVTAGRLTTDQATQQKSAVDQRIDQGMNHVVPPNTATAVSASPTGT